MTQPAILCPIYLQITFTRVYLRHVMKGVQNEFMPTSPEVYTDWMRITNGLTFLMGPIHEFLNREFDKLSSLNPDDPLAQETKRLLQANSSRLMVTHERLTETYENYIRNAQGEGHPSFERAETQLFDDLDRCISVCTTWLDRLDMDWTTPDQTLAAAAQEFMMEHRDVWELVVSGDAPNVYTDAEEAVRQLADGTESLTNAEADSLKRDELLNNPLLIVCTASRLMINRIFFLLLTKRSETGQIINNAEQRLEEARAEIDRKSVQFPEITALEHVSEAIRLLEDRLCILKTLVESVLPADHSFITAELKPDFARSESDRHLTAA